MTPFPYFVEADDTIFEIERLMREHQIRHVPVQMNGQVAGVVSERDMRYFANRSSSDTVKRQVRAREVMSEAPYLVAFDAPLNEVTAEMARRHIGSAIVVHHGKLAGILSSTDVCRILAEILETEFSPTTDDDAA